MKLIVEFVQRIFFLVASLGRLVPATLCLLACGCGTLTYHARHQYVLVRSSPPGADIYYRGEKVGTTPAFVEVRRMHQSEITISAKGESRLLPIKSHYRWDGSLLSNCVFYILAPVGWAVDWASGGAWSMEDPQIPRFHLLASDLPQRQIMAAIAPPSAESLDLSDEGGRVWQSKLPHRFSTIKFLSYPSTVPQFAGRGFDFDSRPSRATEYELFGKMKIDDVFESQFEETKDGVQLHGHFRNVYTNDVGTEKVLTAVPWEAKKGGELPWTERWKGFFQLIPNTVGIELSKSDTELTSDGATYRSAPSRDNTAWQKMAGYLSSLDLTRQQPPRRSGGNRLRFMFVPALRASFRRIEFPKFDPIVENDFSYMQIGAGMGPEVGFQTGAHYFYLNFIPIWGWHRLAWERDDELHVSSIGAVTIRAELGYSYYLTDSLSLRLFSKTTSTPDRIWNTAIQDIAPGSPPVASGSDVSAGLTIGYTFHPPRNIQKWSIEAAQ